MKRSNILFVLGALLLLISCEDEIAFNGTDIEQKLVVNCMIASDSAFIVQVRHSNSIQRPGRGRNIVTNAEVKLYENSNFVGVMTSDTVKTGMDYTYEPNIVYTIKGLKASVGNSYQLEVEAPGYAEVSTQVTIPKPVPIVSVDTSLMTIREEWGGDNSAINFAITFKDNPDEKNFYRIVIKENRGTVGSWGNTDDGGWFYTVRVQQFVSSLQSTDLSINPNGSTNEELFDSGTTNNSMVFNDDLFNGKEHTINVFTGYWGLRYQQKEFIEYSIELHSITKEYYSYAKSLSLFIVREGDPFAEPVQVYSNIEKGYGIFAAYSVSQIVFLDGVYPAESTKYFYR